MYEVLASTKEIHARLRERERTSNHGYQPSLSASSHTTFDSRSASSSGSRQGNVKPKLRACQSHKNSSLAVEYSFRTSIALVLPKIVLLVRSERLRQTSRLMCKRRRSIVSGIFPGQLYFERNAIARSWSFSHWLLSTSCWTGVDERLCTFTERVEFETLVFALPKKSQIHCW